MNSFSFDIVVVNPPRVFGPVKTTEGNSVSQFIKDYILGGENISLGNFFQLINEITVKRHF